MAETAVAIVDREPAPAPLTPMDMLDRAVASGAGIETLERLMALQERWEKNNARRAFDEAMAAAKAEIPVIAKNRHVGFESRKPGAAKTDYWHEDLGEIARTIDPIIGKHGLSYRFRTTSAPNEPVTVTCIVSHRLGHFEENALQAGRDESGNKNSIQSVGSTITYLQRYTLKAAFGLAASRDDDGKAAEQPSAISDEQRDEIAALLEETGSDIAKFCAYFKVENLSEIPASQFGRAVAALQAKRRKA